MSDHQMGWPVENNGEIKMELSYQMLDTSPGSPYDNGYKAQRNSEALSDGKHKYPNDKAKARQWTMGWGAAYADKGPANGGIYRGRGPFNGGPLGYMGETILPIRRGDFVQRDPSGPFCVIAKYAGRNFFADMEGAVKHSDTLLSRRDCAKELLITSIARVVSREPEPKPPLRVRNPRPGEFVRA